MLFLVRILIILGVAFGLGYAALFALGQYVEPEAREFSIPVATPKPRQAPP